MRPRLGVIMPEMARMRGGLAGAVGADQGDELALRDLERDAVQHFDLAVAGVQVVESPAWRPFRAVARPRSSALPPR